MHSKLMEENCPQYTSTNTCEHLRTLRNIIPSRVAEWEQFSEIPGWSVDITFIAHEIADDVEQVVTEIHGIAVTISAIVFSDFLDRIQSEILEQQINTYLLEPLAEKKVPEKIRQQVRDTIG